MSILFARVCFLVEVEVFWGDGNPSFRRIQTFLGIKFFFWGGDGTHFFSNGD